MGVVLFFARHLTHMNDDEPELLRLSEVFERREVEIERSHLSLRDDLRRRFLERFEGLDARDCDRLWRRESSAWLDASHDRARVLRTLHEAVLARTRTMIRTRSRSGRET